MTPELPFLRTNPFNVALRRHQDGRPFDPAFLFWLRSMQHPPIRTVAALVEYCPRVDWLLTFLEAATEDHLVSPALLLEATQAVSRHLGLIKDGRIYTADRGPLMPHTEGLAIIRRVLAGRL